MNILNASIRKTSVVFVFSFLFVFLIFSTCPAQDTYAQKIKAEGEELTGGIIHTTDGGNALLFEPEVGGSVLLRKVNASGKKVWQRELHKGRTDPGGFDVYFLRGGVAELSDGGYILTGALNLSQLDSDPWLVKLTSAGRMDWQKRLVENRFASILSSVVSSADGGFFAAGNRKPDITGTSGDNGVIVASFDSSGDMRWGKVFNHDFQGSLIFFSLSLFITSDQELIVVSQLLSPQTPFDNAGTLVLKVDANGNLLWKKFLKKKDLRFTSGAVTADGGCLLLFSSGDQISNANAARLNSNGDVLWKKRFRVDSQSSTGLAVTQNADGGFAIVGGFVDGLFLAKLDSAGTVVSSVFSDSLTVGEFILPTSDSGYVVFGGYKDAFLLKLDSNANLPGCNPFSAVTIEVRKFGTLKTSSPAITTSDWIPEERTLDISSKNVKVTSSRFCP